MFGIAFHTRYSRIVYDLEDCLCARRSRARGAFDDSAESSSYNFRII